MIFEELWTVFLITMGSSQLFDVKGGLYMRVVLLFVYEGSRY